MRLVHRGKTVRDATAAHGGDWQEDVFAACRALDLPRPLVLPRHERDFMQFRQTRFLPEHFMESVSFDRMEVELIDGDADKQKRKNKDPRNG